MSWQQRLRELVCAGGVIAAAGCDRIGSVPCGNANPDPCICGRMPQSTPQCVAEKACRDTGGSWDFEPAPTDAGNLEGSCVHPGSAAAE